MTFVQELANRIHKSFEVPIDYQSRNTERKVPILDLKVWLARVLDVRTHDSPVLILSFAIKMWRRGSVVPWKAKRTILTQEVLRVLRN